MAEETHKTYKLYLQPLTEIHLNSNHVTHDYRNYKKFDGKYVGTFSVLKGTSGFSTGRGQMLLRNGLVVAQFAVATAMIVGNG